MRELAVFRFIEEAARADLPCPTFKQMTETGAIGSESAATSAFKRLEQAGEIKVVRLNRQYRIVVLPDLGIETADPLRPMVVRRRSVSEIIALVARCSALTTADLTGPNRSSLYTRPRKIACYLARQEGWTYAQIAKVLGGRDHSTVRHACAALPHEVKANPTFRRLFERCKAALKEEREAALAAPRLRVAPKPARRTYRTDEARETTDLKLQMDLCGEAFLKALRREHPQRFAA